MSRIADKEDGGQQEADRQPAVCCAVLCVACLLTTATPRRGRKHHLFPELLEQNRDLTIYLAPFAPGELFAPQPRRARWLSFSKIAQTGRAACHWLLGQ
jgi:hypothetical protein